MYDYFHRDPDLRAADADREAIAERLRRHHAEGRLDTDELQERIDGCYKAKTVGDLEQLVADLPREESQRMRGRMYWRFLPLPFVPLLVIALVVSVAGWHHGGFGLLWLIPLLFVVRFCAWRRFGRWGSRRYWAL